MCLFSNIVVVRLISQEAMIFTFLDGGSNFREQQRLTISVMGRKIINNTIKADVVSCLPGNQAVSLS